MRWEPIWIAAGPRAMTPDLLSVVIPVRDEEANVEPLIREIVQSLEDVVGYEIVVVDDGSRDETCLNLLRLRAAGHRQLRILRHHFSRGQSAALRSGIWAARGEWIISMDGDGQNVPEDIRHFLPIMATQDGVDLICGIRQPSRDSRLMRIVSVIANGVRSRVLGDGVADTGCGLKAIRKDAFLRLPFFDHMHRFLPALVTAARGGVVCVPVHHRPRRFGQSKYGALDRLSAGIVDLLGVLWLRRRSKAYPAEEL